MINELFGIAVEATFASLGINLLRDPRRFLAKLGRPATDKHTRATRLIGAFFLIAVFMALIQWLAKLR